VCHCSEGQWETNTNMTLLNLYGPITMQVTPNDTRVNINYSDVKKLVDVVDL